MKISHKINLIMITLLVVMTIGVMISGNVIISNLAFQFQDQVLKSELQKSIEVVTHTLNRSGLQAAVRVAGKLQTDLSQTPFHLKSGKVFIFEPPDRIVFHQDHKLGESIQWPVLEQMFQQGEGHIEYTYQGTDHYGVFATIRPIEWLICLSMAKEEMFAQRRAYLSSIGFIVVAIFIVCAFAVSQGVRHFVHRIQKTLDCIKRIENGDLEALIQPISIKDEIGSLQAGVNAMSSKIKQRTIERQKAEETLRRYEHIISSTNDLMSYVDKNYTYLAVNNAYLKAHAKKREEIVGFSVENLIGSEKYHEFAKKYLDRALNGEKIQYQAWFEYVGLGRRFMDVTYYPFKGTHNEGISGLVVAAHDLSERKKVEDALSESEARYRNVYNTAPLAFVTWDCELHITEWNKRAEAIFGWSRKEVLGRNFFSFLVPDEDRLQVEKIVQRLLQGDVINHSINANLTKDGKHLIIEWNNSLLLDNEGNVTGAISLGLDITKRKRDEEELKKNHEHLENLVDKRTADLAMAKDAAEKANAAKGEFLANMSHELRTPMNAILGYSQLMQRDHSLAPEQREFLERINRSGAQLLALINEVLEISKIEAGQSSFESRTFDFKTMFGDVAKMFASSMEAKGLQFKVLGTDAVPQYLVTDANKLRQMLVNLLSNAVKFTDQGGITMRVAITDSPGNGMQLAIEVQDTGVGITENEMDMVFAYFEQTASGKTLQKGTGLGLALSRYFARMMGGDITVASEEGKGSTFYLNVAIKEGRKSDIPQDVPKPRVIGLTPDRAIPRILVAEDSEASRHLLVEILTSVGFDVRSAVNGVEAMDMFSQWHPDFIWMDVRMPVMDGLEATRRIKQTATGRSTIVAALTAHALEEERGPILAAGFDDFVRKPFNAQEIFDMMGKYLNLKYVYEDKTETTVASEPDGELGPEQLAALPADLLKRLHEAAIELDVDRILALIEPIRTINAPMAGVLEIAVKKFALGPLLDKLERIKPNQKKDGLNG